MRKFKNISSKKIKIKNYIHVNKAEKNINITKNIPIKKE